MKKKITKWVIYIFIVLLFLFFGINSFKRTSEKKIVEENIQTFHDFCTFSIGDNHEFCTKSLPKQPVIMLFIHPECDFCQAEIRELKENQSELQNVSILLVTSAPLTQAKVFHSNQNLTQFNRLQLLLDDNFKISNYFDVKTIPTVFIYDKNRKLIFKHKGEIKIESLTRYLSEK